MDEQPKQVRILPMVVRQEAPKPRPVTPGGLEPDGFDRAFMWVVTGILMLMGVGILGLIWLSR